MARKSMRFTFSLLGLMAAGLLGLCGCQNGGSSNTVLRALPSEEGKEIFPTATELNSAYGDDSR
jgi:hypothetical protein